MMNQNNNVIHGVEAKKSGSSSEHENKIRCLTLNFFSYKMLLPNASVAEVTELKSIEPKLGAPEWFGGLMTWREQAVPVIIFEKIMNINASKPQQYRRVLILNAPNNKGCSPFIALGCQSIPSLTLIEEERVAATDTKSEQAVHIKLDGENYIIPNISLLESMVSKVMWND
ncbi:MAG: chemotaxis protein CheW [gamma proteobacterium symbiont of Bathyaustriella thionipta]|nr:chemotaxis protein CheW [gamma proteobacterium symbiont of Bathyaustriella thionipta]MCU7951474.1 chemotaxis protein CheW [gamma proteobacterium symbiont of Bathyaustriella thionipta]MCU7953426.1 chemotaxis protein CheW [gamma proteobacterium symbiont of Bathyaustriella thionipta]MCU7958046.1 chemotaxis protein CheW [gamma proteobacterium symbiont of Bathyaustriella thionipta]MCU7968921.1 chemotaxis protein CheW [gamma proteobacterium symbiont of Bathyaustriella thionipta]